MALSIPSFIVLDAWNSIEDAAQWAGVSAEELNSIARATGDPEFRSLLLHSAIEDDDWKEVRASAGFNIAHKAAINLMFVAIKAKFNVATTILAPPKPTVTTEPQQQQQQQLPQQQPADGQPAGECDAQPGAAVRQPVEAQQHGSGSNASGSDTRDSKREVLLNLSAPRAVTTTMDIPPMANPMNHVDGCVVKVSLGLVFNQA